MMCRQVAEAIATAKPLQLVPKEGEDCEVDEDSPEEDAAARLIGSIGVTADRLWRWETPQHRLEMAKMLAAQSTALVYWLEAFCQP